MGGLQDPSISVIILGTLNPRGVARKNVMVIDSTRVSPFHLMATYSITAVVSYCDALLVEAALFSRIPLLCVPSRRNRVATRLLQREQRCVLFPEGFWTESTVRDCLRQAMNLKKTPMNATKWEEAKVMLVRKVEVETLTAVGAGADDRSVEEGLSHVVLWVWGSGVMPSVICVLLIIGVIWHQLYQVVRSSRGRSNSYHVKRN